MTNPTRSERLVVEQTEDYRQEVVVEACDDGSVRLALELWEDPEMDAALGPSGSWADLTRDQAESLSRALLRCAYPEATPS